MNKTIIVRTLTLLAIGFLFFFSSKIEMSSISHIKEYHDDIALMNQNSLSHQEEVDDDNERKNIGRSAWLFFHSVLDSVKDKPNEKECVRLKRFIDTFDTFYPYCSQSKEKLFNEMVIEYPLQCRSRQSIKLWGCEIHNRINTELKKPQFDCQKLFDETINFNKVTIDKEGKQLG